ncbi:MAG: coenzyme F430 synthase [Methanobacteriaceae archaeon]|nr:coenzyme F430 synthase [Methanobacteriaceae archaeon]MDP3035949.1 coenzyme F430 synthase [Methanobacteriaceae archaeon]MDP3484885.1 coenzyme F430 synthase [Methanobacteriaceae archaeon]MDP3623933.1 coenzyme F430 synthase [Methanobacteriaceae archaeon]
MNVLIIDLTHGGLIIALEIAKLDIFKDVWAWDIYQTTSQKQKKTLQENGIKLINSGFKENEYLESKDDLKSFLSLNNPDFRTDDDIKIISPVHCPLNIKPDLSHHQAIKLILDNSKNLKIKNSNFEENLKEKYPLNFNGNSKEIPIIEVTGVKGKTSAVGMLKQIFAPYRPLILSSLGAEIFENRERSENSEIVSESIILKKNISITPASIIETIKLAGDNDYGISIFETSLGATGMADVGLLTNIIEDYPIAGKKSKASLAKEQIFQSKMICCEYGTFREYYGHLDNLKNRLNTFSFNKTGPSNLCLSNVEYGLKKSIIGIKTRNLKTINGDVLNCDFSIETFAPSPYQVENVLAAVSCALTLGMDPNNIKEGLKNFSGLEGRSSIKKLDKINIIEEINPGINITAIENAIKMTMELKNPAIILGGQYGITCEEIDEIKTAELLENIFYNNNNNNNNSNIIPEKKISLILTNELGLGIKENMNYNPHHFFDPQEAVQFAMDNGRKNIVFIYRSNYSNLKQR